MTDKFIGGSVNLIMGSSATVVLVLLLLMMKATEGQMVPAAYVFGDSLVDVGNNNYLAVSLAKANFPHNGIDFPDKKPTGRFCNGKNAADWLAEKLGLPTSPPYLSVRNKNQSAFMTGVSFASGGAGIFNGSDQLLRQSIPLTKQVEHYQSVYQSLIQQMGSSEAQTHLAKSIFAIVIGSNDIFGYSNSSSSHKQSTPPQMFVNLMATSLKLHLKTLYANGARKFALAGVGALGCSPRERLKDDINQDCNQDQNSMAKLYNQQLNSMLQSLKSELGNGFSYSYFDTFSTLQNIILNPSQFGFVEAKAACCGLGELRAKVPCLPIANYCSNRRDHVFWDLFHPTEATYQILIDAFFDGTPQFTSPINIRQLASVST
ncbi:GDSL esterase/lipase At5g55050 [Linum grandiflorum]